MTEQLFWWMIIINVLLLAILFAMIYNLKVLIKGLRSEEVDTEEEAIAEDIWTGAFSKAVPIDQEAEILMDHEYDGIRELDNSLPPWWLWMFYATIIFGVIYIGVVHFSEYGMTNAQAYEAEILEAEEALAANLEESGGALDETNVTYDASLAATGQEIFSNLCIACHGMNGEGGAVGPNLTDEYWINGGGIQNVFKVIKYGVPAKGMVSWKAQLSPSQIQATASYILSLQGSNPENAKEPQGDLWVEEVVEEAAEATEVDSTAVEASAVEVE